MPKNNRGEVVIQLMKERLEKHLNYVESLINTWMQELSVPKPFVIGENSWPVDFEFIPSSEKDTEKNHMIHRHLRNRALWRNHSDWEREIREIERLGIIIYEKAKEKASGSSQNYLQTVLWAAFETAIGGKIKQKYELIDGKSTAFYGYIVGSPHEVKDKMENGHWGLIIEFSKCKEMVELLKTLKEAEMFQTRIIALVKKALLSSDIFYPCKYCKRLMKV